MVKGEITKGIGSVRVELRQGRRRGDVMSDTTTNYAAFRRRLDEVLRVRDPEALTAFLVAEGQWDEGSAHDAEAAMWMMIAASPALKGSHGEAEHWLLTHGHEAEARAILGRASSQASSTTGRPPRAVTGAGSSQGKTQKERSQHKPPQSSQKRRPSKKPESR